MDLLLFGTALVMLILAERLTWLQFQPSSFFRPFFISDFWYLVTGGLLLSVVMRAQAPPWAGVFSESIRQTLADAPVMLTGGMALVLHDLGAYLSHMMLHRFTPLWEFHKVHHSAVPWTGWQRSVRIPVSMRFVICCLLSYSFSSAFPSSRWVWPAP